MTRARTIAVWVLIAVAVAAIATTYLRGGESGTANPGDSGFESGDAAVPGRTISPAATTSPSGRVAASPHDLATDETKGGHTLERHVAKTDAQLAARLKAEPNISAASTYRDRRTAEVTVGEALSVNTAKVEAWRARQSERPNLVLDIRMPSTIGRTMRRGGAAREADSAVVVLKWDGKGGFVLTSYPQER